MKKIVCFLLLLGVVLNLGAQQAREDFKANRSLSASNYVAYPGPRQVALTPAPRGYTPFYISHYGRHGSRYLIGKHDYDQPYFTLLRADSLGKLTPFGKNILQKVSVIRDEALGRDGELTSRGALQHKGIALRMYERFPEVFSGKASVDAKSTVVIRCILSMENALQQLLVLNPQLQIRHDASHHDMYYMNQSDPILEREKMSGKAKVAYQAFCKRHDHYDRIMRELFTDDSYWEHQINASELNRSLFRLASNMQSTDLRDSISLYDLFTDNEIYDNWLQNNAYWYIAYGPSPLNGGNQPYSQRNLLRKIISEADSCIALEHPGVTLRYGHDTMVMPLTCLLDLDGLGKSIDDLEKLPQENWCDYRIFPMACNIQLVFYRRYWGDPDVLVKVLRNENEATLPLKTDVAPYYHWTDFKAYYLKKLEMYNRKVQVN